MPSYKVISKGFFDGRMYDPDGKRRVLHTEKPFPSKDKKEQVPSWLEAIKSEKATQQPSNSDGPTVKELKEKLAELGVDFKSNDNKATLALLLENADAHLKSQQDSKDITDASFMGAGETTNTDSTVETL